MNITSDAKKTVKNLAQQAAKQIVNEPFEILKQGGKQIVGNEENTNQKVQPLDALDSENLQNNQVSTDTKAQMEAQGRRQLQAFENELKEIRIKNEQQEKILEQSEQVAKSQGAQTQKPLVEPISKQGRKMIGTPGHVKKQQIHVENLQPPSG